MRIQRKPHHKDIIDAAQASLYWYEAQRNKKPKAIEVTQDQLYELLTHPTATRDGTYVERHEAHTGQVHRRLFGYPVHLMTGRPRSQSRGMRAPARLVRRYSKIQVGSL